MIAQALDKHDTETWSKLYSFCLQHGFRYFLRENKKFCTTGLKLHFNFHSIQFIKLYFHDLKKYTDIIWTYKDKLWRSSQKANKASKDCP